MVYISISNLWVVRADPIKSCCTYICGSGPCSIFYIFVGHNQDFDVRTVFMVL